MSGDRFDELTKELANGSTSRRGFLTALAGAGVGALFGSGRAAAQVPPGGSTCTNEGQSCTAQQCCQGLNCLADFTSSTEKFCCSPDSPLVCGSKCCPTGAVLGCSQGKCTCPTGQVVCPDANNPLAGRCVNLAEDVGNCGACGVSCDEPTGSDAPCRVRACVNGGCTTVANPGANGVICETGNLCTADTCQNGTCTQGPRNVICADEQCQTCNPDTGTCQPVANGRACDDGNPCTVNDTCQSGICMPGAPKDCGDNNACTTDTCDPTTGDCVHTPVLNNTPCETGNKCTADTCQNGVCQQGPVNVTCGQCLRCESTSGTCVPDTSKNGTSCSDGNACTTGETCQNGTCTGGTLKTCNDNNVCTQDSCDPVTGNCVHTPLTGPLCGMPGSGRTCCSGMCCQDTDICCTAGTNAGRCGRITGSDCSNNRDCCSGTCSGTGSTKKCV